MPAWLVDMIAEPDDEPELPAAPSSEVGRFLSGGSDTEELRALRGEFNRIHSWAELLEPDGWTLDHTDRNGDAAYVQPGKDRREGTSATVYADTDCVHVFTTSLDWLPAGTTVDRYGYAVHRRFGWSNWSDGAKELLLALRPKPAASRSVNPTTGEIGATATHKPPDGKLRGVVHGAR